MKALSIGWVNVKRMLRERSNIFFVFIFPIALVVLIGVQFGGDFEPRIGVHQGDDGEISGQIVDALQADASLAVEPFDSEDDVIRQVERGAVLLGVLIPAGMDAIARDGDQVEIGIVNRPDSAGAELQSVVAADVSDVMMAVGAAQFAMSETGASFDEGLGVASDIATGIEEITVEIVTEGEATFPSTLGRFDLGASSELVLFVFLSALAGSSALILTRQLGISTRMLSTPTPMSTIISGEALGRFGPSLAQGIYIMVLTLIMFGVNWGDPVGATLILVALAAVGAGAGMLMGATFSNSQQASGVGIMLALGMAALGGAMYPLDLFSPTMQKIAHLTPHAWALDGYAELVRRGGTTVDILPELGVLAAYAAVLLALASWRLRVALTRS